LVFLKGLVDLRRPVAEFEQERSPLFSHISSNFIVFVV